MKIEIDSKINANLLDLTNNISFYLNNDDEEIYICSCGDVNIFSKQNLSEEDKDLIKYINSLGGEDSEIVKAMNTSLLGQKKCNSCQKNFLKEDIEDRVFIVGKEFANNFYFEDNDENLIIYNSSIYSSYDCQKNILEFSEKNKYIRLEKKTNKFFYKNFDENEVEFELPGIIKYVNELFVFNNKKVSGILNLQLYINKLAALVSDVEDFDIIKNLLSQTQFNKSALDLFKEIFVLFYSVIKYSNFSTIILTKGGKFFYEMIKECGLPPVEKLQESNATSPIKIFHFLAKSYNDKLQKEVNSDNKSVHDFIYKSDGKNLSISLKNNTNYKEGKIKKVAGEIKVSEVLGDGKISKLLYNKIRSFKDYIQIIKYLKHIEYNKILDLIQKYDIDFLVRLIDIIYFRAEISWSEINNIISIVKSFCEEQTYNRIDKIKELKKQIEIEKSLGRPNSNKSIDAEKQIEKEKSILPIDYKHVNAFSFERYDDSLMMLNSLGFNRNRHFDKIKDYNNLLIFHDKLVSYYSSVKEVREANLEKFNDFVSKFRFLETKGEEDYEGPLLIKIIDTPEAIIREGVEMSHSASAYVTNVMNGNYLMVQVLDETPNLPEEELIRFTAGFHFDKYEGLTFDQVKAFANQEGSDRFKKLLMDYLIAKDVSFQALRDLKLREGEE